jgi:tetratricopeptide (TPR) repeat protein
VTQLIKNKIISTGQFRRIFFCVVCLCFFSGAIAQDFKRQYKEAKENFTKGDYTKAMAGFNGLIVYDSENPYSEYSAYYYGLSALKLGFNTVAKDIFIQTIKLHPTWAHIDDINYLLAKIYFDQREYFRALLILGSIKDPSIIHDYATMKRFYLSQINDVETLKMVMEEHPGEAEGARALAKVLAGQPVQVRETKLLDSLIRKFNLNRDEFPSDAPLAPVFKDRYSISLLFPFLTSSLDPTPGVKRNQFVIDLYEGMKLAADTLKHEGIMLDLLAYDTDRSTDVVQRLLATEELKFTDLIVGPLFMEEAKLVLPFSEKNKVNIINPVSNNSDFLGQDPFALLFQPSHETMGAASAGYIAAHVKNKNCMVYFGENPKDSTMAFNYMKRARELGLKIVWAEEIHKENSADILTALTTATDFDEYKNPIEFSLKRDSIGSIFVASDDPLIYSKVISAVETRADSVLVVGQENWINPEYTVDYGIYERTKIILAAPNFSSISSPAYAAFHKHYVSKHGLLPSAYARIGFEFTMFIGRALKKYGVYYQSGISQDGVIPGVLGEGHNFPGTRDNQLVPFVRFHKGRVVIADQE